ncbi:protein FAM189B isoform X2 [Sparus aurata]|uniref:protein FAM189B isoform X2 n=1 Tax=Sparus aurata TaxID=8175 RepID=UPI0011C0FA58|nr:protein FAM189B isoform X2 [Sparus aurata]
MPSPSDSSSVASASGSRGWSDSRRGMSGRGPGGARLLLYLGLCHLGLGAMVLAFSFTSMAFTSSARVRQSCPFWAGFFVVASGIVGIISWRRPLTLVVSLFMLLSAVCVILSLAGSMLSCQNAQMVKSMLTCQMENGLCVCCAPTQPCSMLEDETLVLYQIADCHSVRHQLKDLLFSACGLSILSTIICTLSTVTCSIHIFSLDLVHLLAPHRSRSVNPECTTPQDAFLTNIMDFEEFVPPIPPPPYYPPEYTCSSETDAQSITYNGSMESPVPLYPTDCPPPYEAVMGQRAATVYEQHGNELSGERGTSTAFSGEVSMDSGSLLMSEIVDIPDDSSPSEDSCLMEVGLRNQGERGNRTAGEGGDGVEVGEHFSFRGPTCQTPESPLAGGPRARRFIRGERSNSCSSPSTATTTYSSLLFLHCRSPVLRRQAMLASSCSQLEAIEVSTSQQRSSIPEFRICPSTPSRQGATPASSAPPTLSTPAAREQSGGQGNGPPFLGQLPLYLQRRAGKVEKDGEGVRRDSEGLLRLVRSHSEPGLGSSTDTVDFGSVGSKASTGTGPSSEACLLPRTSLPPAAALPRKGSMKSAATGVQVPSKPTPTSPLRLPKDCHRSLGDLKVTRGLVARFLQRSKRNLSPSTEHAGNTGQGPKRRTGTDGAATNHLPLEQVLLTPWNTSRGHPNHHTHHPHRHGHHHSHSDSRHNRHHGGRAPEGIHLRSCGDLSSSSSASLRRLMTPNPPHGSSGALYSESAL